MKRLRRTVMNVACAVLGTVTMAQEVVRPSRPTAAQLPRANHLGERVTGIRLSTTSVIELPGGETVLLYGYIVGKPNGDSNYFLWNDALDLACYGKTERQADGSGLGDLNCDRGDTQVLTGPFLVVAEKYGRLRATVSAVLATSDGRPYRAVLRWHGRDAFPDPEPLLAAFGRS